MGSIPAGGTIRLVPLMRDSLMASHFMFSTHYRPWLPPLLLFLGPLALYFPSLGNYFVAWDDNILVYANPLVRNFSPYAVWAVFTSYDPELYIPLTFLTYQIEHLIFGLNATVFHTTNLLLHCGISVMIFFLLRRWSIGKSAAFVLALLFAIHPLNSEAVAWVSARKDVLSSFFFLATLLEWERYREDQTQRKYWIAALFFLLALLSKVSIVLLPLILLLIDWRDNRTLDRRMMTEKIPFFALAGVFIVIALLGKTGNISALSLWQTVLMSSKAIGVSVLHFFFPFQISLIYQQSTPITLASPEFFLPVLFVLFVLFVTAASLKKTRSVAFAGCFTLIMLLPSFANFSKAGSLYFTTDRYMYMAQLGLLFLLGWGWMRIVELQRARAVWLSVIAILCVAIPSFAFATYNRSLLWIDSETLFRDALLKNPQSAIIRFNLGYFEQTRGNIEEARSFYAQAREVNPNYSPAFNNEGLILWERGERTEAESWFTQAAEIDPHNLSAVINLAMAKMERGEVDEAIALLTRALEEDPYNVPALIKLGTAYGKKEMYREGLAAFQKAWRLDPVMREKSKELERMLLELDKS